MPARRAVGRGFGRLALGGQKVGGRQGWRCELGHAIDHEHAFAHLLDHQLVELRLLASQLHAAFGAALFPRQARRELAGQYRNRKQAKPVRPAWVNSKVGRRLCLRIATRPPQNGQGSGGSNAQRHQPGQQNRCHQNRQDQQCLRELKLAPAR